MSRDRKLVGTAVVAGAVAWAGLAVLLSSAPVLTDAQWVDNQAAAVHLEYQAPSPGPTDPGSLLEEWTPEHIEYRLDELLEHLDEETLIETIQHHEDAQRIAELEELAGLVPETAPGTDVEPVLPPHSQNHTPGMVFCYRFEVRNENSSQELWWEATFDTTQPPFWGWEPYGTDGQPNYHYGYNSDHYGLVGDRLGQRRIRTRC